MTANRLSGLVFVGIGLCTCWAAVDMSLGSLPSPGPGLYPLVLGALLALLGAILLGTSVLSPGGRREAPAPRSANAKTVVAATVALLAYTALLPTAGFGASTFVLLGALLRLGGMRWSAAVLLSLGLTAGTLVTASLINVPLPAGTVFHTADA